MKKPTADKVLAQSIISFGFDEDVVLFLKLTERPTDEEYVKKITTLIDKIRQETEQEQQAEAKGAGLFLNNTKPKKRLMNLMLRDIKKKWNH